jgi:hypothetical protein
MRYRAGYEQKSENAENDLTEPGAGITIEWFEAFIEDLHTGKRIRMRDFMANTEAELAALMSKAEGIVASMNDDDMLRVGLNAPIIPEDTETQSDVVSENDDAITF